MYAKLFSRITESSLMEAAMEVRYTFMMLLAISDQTGHVIGTDIAIARRLNMPLDQFERCAAQLMQPDPDSNSREEEGRRIVPSEGERGYKVVNFLTYRDMKTEDDRRDYMREYMKKRREAERLKKGVNSCKHELAQLTHAEVETEAKEDTKAKTRGSAEGDGFAEFWSIYPRKVGKGNAEKAWIKHGCRKLLPKILSTIRSAKLSVDWSKEGGQFIPHPATWLNRKGWDDELMPSGGLRENIKPKIVWDADN